MKITVEVTIAAPIEDVWRAWITPDDIKQGRRLGYKAQHQLPAKYSGLCQFQRWAL